MRVRLVLSCGSYTVTLREMEAKLRRVEMSENYSRGYLCVI